MYKDILLTVDLDQKASWEKALPVAMEYVRAFGANLHVMTVIPPFGMSIVGQFFPSDYEKQVQESAMAALHTFVKENVNQGLKVQHIVAQGTVYEEIIDTAGKIGADLIVVAAHGPRLQDYLLGPNAARVVRHSDRTVLVVR
ncbi:universal stress protein [Pseudomonadota bacterium]